MSGITTLLRRLTSLLQRFCGGREGAAAVEFALITPFLITLYLGSIEISDLIAVDRRVSVVSGTTGDLVARSNGSIDADTLTDYFKASEGIILPYSDTGLKQTVSLIEVNATGVTKVKWSQAYNGGTVNVVGNPYTLPPEMIAISKSNWVIVSESSYSYRPLLGFVIKSAINLHRVSFYLPRYATIICYNTTSC